MAKPEPVHEPGIGQFISTRPKEKFVIDLTEISKDVAERVNLPHLYILNCVDHFSKKAWGFVLKTKEATEVKDCMMKILNPEKPDSIQTDLGTEFTNQELKDSLNAIGVQLKSSGPRKPEHQGAVEKFHDTIKSTFPQLMREKGQISVEKIESFLWKVIREYNSQIHSTTNSIPEEVYILNPFKPDDKTKIDEIIDKTSRARIKKPGKILVEKGDKVKYSNIFE
jgi:transposase InsO family protein